MRHYEVVAVIHPDQQGRIAAMIELYKKIVADGGGVLHRLEDWGRRPLAYPIQNQHKAQYVLMNIECDDETLGKLRETFRFSDSIIRSLVVRRDGAITGPSVIMREAEERDNESAPSPDVAGGESADAAKTSAGEGADFLLAKIKERIIAVARKGGTITYGDLAKDVGAASVGRLFGPLDKINDESVADKSLLLSIVVVNDDGLPGEQFYEKAAKKWGKDVNPDDEKSRRQFFAEECARVYDAYSSSAAGSGKLETPAEDAAAGVDSSSAKEGREK